MASESESAGFEERARQGAAACRQILPALLNVEGSKVDGSAESLALIDSHSKKLQEIFGALPSAEEAKQGGEFISKQGVIFLLGAYFGEVLRGAFDGGKWQGNEKWLDSKLAWELPGKVISVQPFKDVYLLLSGKGNSPLHESYEAIARER
jgi:hypothetical protein